jgi:hypothetical protein
VEKDSGHYYEIISVVEDAVHIGAQMALNGEVNYSENGDIEYEDLS